MPEADLRATSFKGAELLNMDVNGERTMNDVRWTQAYLAGASLTNINICGSYSWDEAIFEDTDPETGRTLRATLNNITGPDCYLYYADRTDREDIVPI